MNSKGVSTLIKLLGLREAEMTSSGYSKDFVLKVLEGLVLTTNRR